MADVSSHHPGRDIENGKFVEHSPEFSVEAGTSLPEGYGDNRLVVMARDPFWFFAYWEITHERAEQIRVAHGSDCWDLAKLILRVYDLGQSSQTPLDQAGSLDVEVQKFSRQWYVQVPHSGHVYFVDLGLRWPDGKYVSLFRSNTIRQPVGRVSDHVESESQWMTVGTASPQQQQINWEAIAQIALGSANSKGGSASGTDTLDSTSLRWEYLRSVFSGSTSSWRPQEPKP